jgi:voltage-gated potassium channel
VERNNSITFKTRIFNLVDKGSHGTKCDLLFDYFIVGLIILNILAIILESIVTIGQAYKGFFRGFEVISVIVFTIEYLMRLYVSDLTHPSKSRAGSLLKFIFSGYGLIDLFAILPFYLPFIFKVDLRFIRALRLLRFFRIFKVNRYNRSLRLIGDVIREKKTELSITGFVAFIILLVASILMYYIEGPVQPDKFPNILSSFWWAIATLTTVGYGDVFPVTALGKVVSGAIAVLGIGLVALPTGLISVGFIEKIGKKKEEMKRCPHCGHELESIH